MHITEATSHAQPSLHQEYAEEENCHDKNRSAKPAGPARPEGALARVAYSTGRPLNFKELRVQSRGVPRLARGKNPLPISNPRRDPGDNHNTHRYAYIENSEYPRDLLRDSGSAGLLSRASSLFP